MTTVKATDTKAKLLEVIQEQANQIYALQHPPPKPEPADLVEALEQAQGELTDATDKIRDLLEKAREKVEELEQEAGYKDEVEAELGVARAQGDDLLKVLAEIEKMEHAPGCLVPSPWSCPVCAASAVEDPR